MHRVCCHVISQVAFKPDGSPSPALLGFCKKNGVNVDDVTREADTKGTEYVWAAVREEGRSAAEVRVAINAPHYALYMAGDRERKPLSNTCFSMCLASGCLKF